MTPGSDVRKLADATANFGYLLVHDPVLVTYGAIAERAVFDDPNTAMVKCRQFGEALAAQAFAQFGIPDMPKNQYKRVQVLANEGFLTQRVRSWFDLVRQIGNKANHEGHAARRDALLVLRASYDLGAWFHRTVSDDAVAPPFVPPQPPQQQPTSETDAQAFAELQELLKGQRNELAEIRLRLDEHQEFRGAETAAQRAAAEEIQRAGRAQAQMAELIQQLTGKVDDLQQQLEHKAANVEPINPTQRDEYLERAKTAGEPPLNEAQVRRLIDRMLADAGWLVQDVVEQNLHATTGVAVREVQTAKGRADYLLYVDQKLIGVIEAKREGTSLTDTDRQSDRYAANLTPGQQLTAWRFPLPFRYESSAVQTQFTNTLDPIVRPRRVFSFHQPQTIARWMRDADDHPQAPTLRHRLRSMPPLITEGLRDAQVEAITGLEASLAHDRPRGLIQMATGAGKTYTMVTETYRLLRHAQARRILFLVDRNNLGKQAHAEFDNYRTPDDSSLFGNSYNVRRLRGGVVQGSTHVVISTVQRLYAMLRGTELPEDDEDPDLAPDAPVELDYNAAVPPETFDLVIVDECHRSIYGIWRSVLEYFDAYLVGLTATPVFQTFGFFHENLVSQYTYRQAVADKVNVDYDIMRIRTEVGEHGGAIPADVPVRIVDTRTKKVRYEPLDSGLNYNADAIGRSVMNISQLRKVIEKFRDGWPEYFPQRRHVPKTLIFAKTDQHAEEIVQIVREIFGGDNKFCTKITYRADNPEQLISDFRNDPAFRIAVTVDMIATGTDVRPLECVVFLRGVSSATYFEQMKGRGARTVDADEFQRVTPDARAKEKFLIVDPVGVTDSPLVDARPLQPEAQRTVSLEKLLNKAGSQGITTDEAGALASRLAKLDIQITPAERAELAELANGTPLRAIVRGLQEATEPDAQDDALQTGGKQAQRDLVLSAIKPLAEHPELRERIIGIRRKYDLPYDEYTQDKVLSVQARRMGEDTARHTVEDWRQYMAEHADEIAPFRLAFAEPGTDRTELYRMLKRLAAKIEAPPHRWTPARLWQAYRNLGIAQGNGRRKDIPDLMAILRFELGVDKQLRPSLSTVEENLTNWLARQEQQGVKFSTDQRWWLNQIAVAIANRLTVTGDDLDGVPFSQHGGADGFLQAFGEDRAEDLLADLNRNLPA